MCAQQCPLFTQSGSIKADALSIRVDIPPPSGDNTHLHLLLLSEVPTVSQSEMLHGSLCLKTNTPLTAPLHFFSMHVCNTDVLITFTLLYMDNST